MKHEITLMVCSHKALDICFIGLQTLVWDYSYKNVTTVEKCGAYLFITESQ